MGKRKTGEVEAGDQPEKMPHGIYEGIFEVFDVCSRRLRNGNKLRVVLEAPYDRAEEKMLLDFKFGDARIQMMKYEPQPELTGINEEEDDSKEEAEGQLREAGVIE